MKKFKLKLNLEKISIKPVTNKEHSNLLSYATLIFKDEQERKLTLGGFTVWKSKYEGYNVEPPSRENFTFYWFEETLWREIEKRIIAIYKYEEEIPVIDED